jgi:hypothetical protein
MYVEYPNDRWSARFGAKEVQRNFDPAVGFVTRRDYRRYQPGVTFAPRPRAHPTSGGSSSSRQRRADHASTTACWNAGSI